MNLVNLTFVAVLVGCCVLLSKAQTYKYKSLTVDQFKQLCQQNNVNLSELTSIHETVEGLLMDSIEPVKNPDSLKEKKHCLGKPVYGYLKSEMNIAKRCINGTIQLDDSSVHSIIQESERKLCALSRLGSYEEYLANKTCLNATNAENCQMNVLQNNTMENSGEFANLGLSHTENGRKTWITLFDCSRKEIRKSCGDEIKKRHDKATKEFTDCLKVNRIRPTLIATPPKREN